MELVYLWVEDYKNIKKQGFNFSPRFKCEYDEEKNELAIDENKDYVSIFPENINITAIVGENGVGKTSLLKFLIQILNNRHYMVNDFFAIYMENISNKIVFYKQGKNINIKKNKYKFEIFWDNDLESNWVNYNYKYEEISSIIHKHSIFNRYGSLNTFKHIHILNKYKNILSIINDKYYFNTLQVVIKEKDTSFIKEHMIDGENYYFKKEIQELLYKFLEDFKCPNQPQNTNDINRISKQNVLIKKERLMEYNTLLFFIHFIQLNKDEYSLDLDDDHIEDWINSIKDYKNIYDFLDTFENFLLKNEQFNIFYNIFNELYGNIKYLKDIQNNFIKDEDKKEYLLNYSLDDKKKIDEVISNTQYITGLSSEEVFYCNFIEYRFMNLEKNIFFDDLSDGEKNILLICIDFLHQLDLEKEKNKIFVFDEIDNSLHPFWKKELLNIIMKLLKEFKVINNHNKTTNIIFTTHSPFLISDLPKENVLFLEKGKQVYPFEDNQQTFGANIHTLLSHGFFMKDGLMGEFAKDKINEVYEYLTNSNTQSKLTQKDAQNIIKLIGEPILKKELQSIFDKKFQVDDIDKKIREHEEAIKKLKSQRNNND
ncbi:MAG: AAA family ATPase [Campylobacteraceae bacterium]|nr:AAA family ATPase [Campylobacteraceae bacterium]